MYSDNASTALQNTAQTKRDSIQAVAIDTERNIERLSKLNETLLLIGNRIEGQRPEPVSADAKPEQASSSVLMDLRRKHSTISRLIDHCEGEAQRIAAAIGNS